MINHSSTEELFQQYIKKSHKEKKRRQTMIHFVAIILVVCCLFSLIGIARVTHSDMGTTYQEGDIIIYEKVSSQYHKDDIVLIQYDKQILIRRIIGVYKDKIDIQNKDGSLYLNNQKENTSQMTMSDPLGVKFPLYVAKNQYFVLCDQRTTTTDSRRFGCIQEKQIIGRIIYKIRL